MSLIQIKAKFLSKDMYQANNFLVLEGMKELDIINDIIRNKRKGYSPINKKLGQYYIKVVDKGIKLISRQTYSLGLYITKNIKKNNKVYYHFIIQQFQQVQNFKPLFINDL